MVVYSLILANYQPDFNSEAGSFRGHIWVTVDSKENYTFTDRLTEAYFEIDHGDEQRTFKYYWIHITENNGAGVQFQLAEFRLLQYY